jgi:WD40 repeat protein
VNSLAFSPDGRILASGGYDSSVILWDPQRGQRIGEPLKIPGGSGVNSVAFSPDGRILVSGGDDGSVILWDVDIESWKERACRTANRNLTQSEWTQYLGNEPYHKTCSNAPEGG